MKQTYGLATFLLEILAVLKTTTADMENTTEAYLTTMETTYNSTLFGNDSVFFNNTANDTEFNQSDIVMPFGHEPKYGLVPMVVICIVLSFLILATIIGNVFVIAAVLLERSLQGVSNYLILSLAVTDLLVAIIVMPLSLVNEVSKSWYLGNALCDFWICVDVLCCTASILHLVAISLDRFWGVSNIDYIRRRCAKQILFMIGIVWIVAVCISIPPLFGWKDSKNDPETQGVCVISQDLGYTVFSTLGAFYCPLFLMVFLNFKIYIAARSRIRRKNFVGRNKTVTSTFTQGDMKTTGRSSSMSEDDGYTMYNGSMAATCGAVNDDLQVSDGDTGTPAHSGYLAVPSQQCRRNSSFRSNGHLLGPPSNIMSDNITTENSQEPMVKFTENNNHKLAMLKRKKKRRDADKKRKDKIEMKRERKAAKVLGIITGAFIACWLPFFVLAVLAPFCGQYCEIPDAVISFCLWLGYVNSSLNPILYTIFNPSFRKAFHKIIYGKYRLRG